MTKAIAYLPHLDSHADLARNSSASESQKSLVKSRQATRPISCGKTKCVDKLRRRMNQGDNIQHVRYKNGDVTVKDKQNGDLNAWIRLGGNSAQGQIAHVNKRTRIGDQTVLSSTLKQRKTKRVLGSGRGVIRKRNKQARISRFWALRKKVPVCKFHEQN